LEGGLPLIALSDADIIVSPSYIELGEVSRALESMDEIVDEGGYRFFCVMALSA
jgi:hypothetical protein